MKFSNNSAIYLNCNRSASKLSVIFEDLYMCVSLIYKDKLQDDYSIFNEITPKLSVSSNKKMARGSVLKGLITVSECSLN